MRRKHQIVNIAAAFIMVLAFVAASSCESSRKTKSLRNTPTQKGLTVNEDSSIKPFPPIGLTATRDEHGVWLTWESYPGKTELWTYRVYRREKSNDFRSISEPKSNGYYDKNLRTGVRYTYTVTGIDNYGNECHEIRTF